MLARRNDDGFKLKRYYYLIFGGILSVMIQQLLLQFILILLNAFFAATEIALISLNEKKIRSLADDGDKKAKN